MEFSLELIIFFDRWNIFDARKLHLENLFFSDYFFSPFMLVRPFFISPKIRARMFFFSKEDRFSYFKEDGNLGKHLCPDHKTPGIQIWSLILYWISHLFSLDYSFYMLRSALSVMWDKISSSILISRYFSCFWNDILSLVFIWLVFKWTFDFMTCF